jgi:ABC-type Fe3+-hydroxamate transport system substrate-binding protein
VIILEILFWGSLGAILWTHGGYPLFVAALAAVRRKRVVIVPANLVTRAGPRVAQGLEAIARALHPDAFQ